MLVAAAAMRSGAAAGDRTFACVRLPDGRVGNHVRGWTRPVRDDVKDRVPHGDVDLERGLVVSCNAYFAQLAVALGPRPLLDAASLFGIEVARPATDARARRTLAHAGYGQGEVVVSPLRMARVAAAVASQGSVTPVRWTTERDVADRSGERLLSPAQSGVLGRYLREAVTSGTGRALAAGPVAIAGKTGTAEVDGAPAHSWFAGYAPYGGERPIAFAVIVENAGYGARSAAPIAGDVVSAARALELIR
jgi:peptidoglycan glycosyltransferase